MIILWILLAVVVVATIVFIFIVGLPQTQNIGGPIVNVPCDKPFSQVPDVTSTQFEPCYEFDSNVRSQRYYDKNNDWTVLPLDRSVIPSADQVCLTFCTQTQLPTECVNQNQDFLNCLTKLSPTNQGCTDPAVPVARRGSQFYYAIGKGKVSCYPALRS